MANDETLRYIDRVVGDSEQPLQQVPVLPGLPSARLKVYINGTPLVADGSSYTVDPIQGVVTLAEPALPGDTIRICLSPYSA